MNGWNSKFLKTNNENPWLVDSIPLLEPTSLTGEPLGFETVCYFPAPRARNTPLYSSQAVPSFGTSAPWWQGVLAIAGLGSPWFHGRGGPGSANG